MADEIETHINELLLKNSVYKSPQSIQKVKDSFSFKRSFDSGSKDLFSDVVIENLNIKKSEEEISCNPFKVKASFFALDLLTDSGTSTLRSEQEDFKNWFISKVPSIQLFSYARLTPRIYLDKVIEWIFGSEFVFFPVLQGRAAEKLLLDSLLGINFLKKDDVIISNRPFDTTKGHIQNVNLQVKSLTKMASPEIFMSSKNVFLGNIPEEELNKFSDKNYSSILLTMTDNGGGGQPVSMKNYKLIAQKAIVDKKLLWLDACRVFENAVFIKAFEEGYETKSIKDIVAEIFSLADVITLSFKKIYSHSGGGILINKKSKILSKENISDMSLLIKKITTVTYGNGFDSYSGLTGDGMVEIISGLITTLNEEVVANRISQIGITGAYLREKFNLPIVSGGHALYLASDKILPNVSLDNCPAEYLNSILMNSLKIRSCGLGFILYAGREETENGVKFNIPLDMDSLRLAIPREVYTTNELISFLSVLGKAYKEGVFKNASGGLKPKNYTSCGFYHFGGDYEILNKIEFEELVDGVQKNF